VLTLKSISKRQRTVSDFHMNVLYIPSGYFGIYHYKDQWVFEEFNLENHCKQCTSPTSLKQVESIVENFQPNIMFTLLGYKIDPSIISFLKKRNVKLAVWLTEDPFTIDLSFRHINKFDYVFTIDRGSREIYKKRGHPHVYHVPLGINNKVFARDPSMNTYKSDICIVGTPYPDRVQLVKHLLSETDLKIQIVGPRWEDKIRDLSDFKNVKLRSDWVSPKEVSQYYQEAKIIINPHRPSKLKINKNRKGVKNQSINVRAFEIAACESFQLISDIPDLHDHFQLGSEIISYQDQHDLIKKINYYLDHEREREKIAEKARYRTLNEHTYRQRIKSIINILETSP